MTSRSVGTVDALTKLKPNDHACWTFSGTDGLRRAAATFLHAGIDANERMMWIADPTRGDPWSVIEPLTEAKELVHSGQLVIADVLEEYANDENVDAAARVAGFETLAAQARAEGYRGIRVLADNTPLVPDVDARLEWLAYERGVDDMVAVNPIIGVCAFDREVLDTDALTDLACVHAVHCGHVVEAPFRVFRRQDTLVLQGEIDLFAHAQFDAALSGTTASGLNKVDAQDLTFIDVSGVRRLHEWVTTREQHRGCEIIGASPSLSTCWNTLFGS